MRQGDGLRDVALVEFAAGEGVEAAVEDSHADEVGGWERRPTRDDCRGSPGEVDPSDLAGDGPGLRRVVEMGVVACEGGDVVARRDARHDHLQPTGKSMGS